MTVQLLNAAVIFQCVILSGLTFFLIIICLLFIYLILLRNFIQKKLENGTFETSQTVSSKIYSLDSDMKIIW